MTDYLCIMMPFPLSVNNLYGEGKNRRFRTKRYNEWIAFADKAVAEQRPFPHFEGRVDIIVHLGGGRIDADCDNFNKVPIDFLVRNNVIKDDCKPYVRSAKAIWDDDVNGCMVEVILIKD